MQRLHASCVLIGEGALLITGPSGSGKSSLVLELILNPPRLPSGARLFTRLVADDQTMVENHAGRLLATAPTALSGLLEIRGQGIVKLPFTPMAKILAVAALGTGPRLPDAYQKEIEIENVALPVIYIEPGDARAVCRVLAGLHLPPASLETNCQ